MAKSFVRTGGPPIAGTPKAPVASFTIPTTYFLDVITRLTLTQRATMEGTASLVLTDDFATRSRIVLAG